MAGFFTSKTLSNKLTILILNASFLFLLALHFKTSLSSSSSTTNDDDNPSFLNQKSSNIIVDVGNCAGLHDYSDHKSKCIYVKSNLGCRPKGYVNYLQIFYCTCGAYPVLGYALILLWLALLFYLLGDTAANYFCSSLESLSTILHLSPTIAGITLLSLGNGAADVFAGVVSFTGAGSDGDFGLNSILGGAFFVSNVVVGIISILISPHDDEDDDDDVHHHPITIDKTGFIRDVIFFIFSLSSLLLIIFIGRISLWGSICFASIYVLYVFAVCTTTFFEEKFFNKMIVQYCHPYHKLIRIQESETLQTSVPLLGYVDDNEDNNKKTDLLEKGEGGGGSGSGPHNLEDRKEPSSSPPPSSSSSRLNHQFDSSKCYYYMGKCLYVLELPLCLPRRMSIPVIKEEKWSKPFAVISVALAPLLMVALCSSQRGGGKNIGHSKTSLVAYMIAGFIGLVLGNIAFLTTKMSSPPKNCLLPWLVGGFLMSVTWTYITAEELVSLLVSIGNILGISPSVLGLTVLAWGNSLADLITNVTMAKDGGNDGAQIAISGCYAGPMFNTLVGLGLSLVLSSWSVYPSCYVIPIDTSLYETIGFLIAGLLWALVILPRNNMKLDRFLGWGLLAIYMCFLFLRLARSLGLLT